MGLETRINGLRQLAMRITGETVRISASRPKPDSHAAKLLIRQMQQWRQMLVQAEKSVKSSRHHSAMLHSKSRFTKDSYSATQRLKSSERNNSKVQSQIDEIWTAIARLNDALFEPDPIEKTALDALGKILKRMQSSGDDGQIVTVPREDVMPHFSVLQPQSPSPSEGGLNAPGPVDTITLVAMFLTLMISKMNRKK